MMVQSVQVTSSCNAAYYGSVSCADWLGSAGEEVLISAATQRETSLGALRIPVSLSARALHVILQIHRSIDGY
jgi:hypothetical protein